MNNCTEPLHPPVTFDFPFTPYDIQHDFMTKLYSVIENKQIGIFESPTGTGKSLSLVCGTLRWLRDHDEQVHCQLVKDITRLQSDIAKEEASTSSGFDWLENQAETIKLKEQLRSTKHDLELLLNRDQQIAERRKRVKNEKKKPTWKVNAKKLAGEDLGGQESVEEEMDEFIINDVADEVLADEEYEKVQKFQGVQVYYCSRTHSQLSQVVNEVKNTVYGKTIQITSLASRQNYCINASVRKLNANALINEQCLELQKGSCKSTTTATDETTGTAVKKRKQSRPTKCQYYSQNSIQHLRDSALVDVMDIEELVQAAKVENACPYYAARLAAQDAQVVMLPYQMLLHKRTRLQTGLSLKNSVVIIDEGHNLVDTISNIYSAEVSQQQLQQAHQQLVAYKNKYFTRFSTKNLLTVNQLIFVTNRLCKLLDGNQKKSPTRMILAHELTVEGDFFNINLNEILDFCERTRLAQKVHGYAQRYGTVEVAVKEPPKPSRLDYLKQLSDKVNSKEKKTDVTEEKPTNPIITNQNVQNSSSVMRPLLAFLECLMEKSEEGRILLSYSDGLKSKSFMKYLLLNPSSHFADIVNECRAVIVAGGTMQPTAEFRNQLFSTQLDRVQEHFFGHVVAKESILPMAITKGPTNVKFLFNFANRNSKELLTELSRTLQNVCNVVPAGVVCFFGSYDYMDGFYKFLEDTGSLNIIRTKKVVFREPRNSNQVERMLIDYSKAAKQLGPGSQNGAFLLSVVGGKLSEGLNFSDDLGRCVVVVGLPFPNKNNPELAEKIRYLDKTYHHSAGAEYYENICMKAVNQCIGRAVRHINDYASVLLLDERYAEARIIKKLPLWIGRSLRSATSFGIVQGSLAKFFREKR